MNETFGVILKAVTSQFSSKIKEAQKLASEATNKVQGELNKMADGLKNIPNQAKKSFSEMKSEFQAGLYLNTSEVEARVNSLSNDLEKAQAEYEKLSHAKKPDTASIEALRNKISSLQISLRGAKNDLDILNNSNIANLGAKVSSIGQKIKSAFTVEGAKKNLTSLGSKLASVFSKGRKQVNSTATAMKKFGEKAKSSLKKVVLAAVGVQTVYRGLQKAVTSYLSFDTQLSDQLQSTWAGLGSVLAPIIERVINLFSKAVAYVNAFVKALFGVDSVARANAKALANQNKQANKSLSSMDEITNIDTGKGGGNDVDQISLPEVDTSKVEEALRRIKEIASYLFDPIKQAWDTMGKSVLTSAKNMLNSIWELIKSIGASFGEVWTNGTGQEIVEKLLYSFQLIFDIIGGIADRFKNAWNQDGNGTQIIQDLADTFIHIQDFVNSIGESLKQWVLSESFQNALNAIVRVVKDLIGYVEDIAGWVVDMYNKYLKPVVDEFLLLISDVIDMIGAIWDVCKPVIDKIIATLKTYLEPAIQVVSSILGAIIGVIRGIVNIVTGALKGNWDQVFKGMKTIAKSIINGIIGFFNGWIKGLNALLKPLRKLIVSIAKAFGGKVSLDDVKIPSIPKLDVGTNYVPEDQLAMIHKGEAVVPKKFNSAEYFSNVNNNAETNALLMDVNRNLLELIDKDTNLYVNGKELAQATYKDFKNEEQRLGTSSTVTVR